MKMNISKFICATKIRQSVYSLMSAMVFSFACIGAYGAEGDCDDNTIPDYLEPDADRDGVIDSCDNCVSVSNEGQFDFEGDGYGNACDADLDNSGYVNFGDLAIFKREFNSSSPLADFDNSGFVNFGDLAGFKRMFGNPAGGNHDLLDVDTDGEADVNDNCIYVSNADQNDADNDGIGDACEAIEQAKDFVKKIRTLATASTYENLGTGSTQFQDELDMAQAVLSDDADAITTVLSEVGRAFSAAGYAYYVANGELDQYIYNDIVVDITPGTNATSGVLAINATITVAPLVLEPLPIETVDVSLSATMEANYIVETDVVEGEFFERAATGSMAFSLSGVVEDASVAFNITEASQLYVDLDVTDGFSDTDPFGGIDLSDPDGLYDTLFWEGGEVRELRFNLDANIAQKADVDTPNPVNFSGAFLMEVHSVKGINMTYEGPCGDSCTGIWEHTFTTIDDISFTFFGEFSDSVGNQFSAAFSLALDNPEQVFIFQESIGSMVTNGIDYIFYEDAFNSNSVTGAREETDDAFLGLAFTLDLQTNIEGVSDNVSVTLSGDRLGLQEGELNLVFNYGVTNLATNFNFTDEVLTMVEGDVELRLWRVVDNLEEEIAGSLSVQGVEKGTVEQRENGIIFIRYNDGAFNSLM